MNDVAVRIAGFFLCALIGAPAIARICLALKDNRDPIRRW